jgi:hypothetical protein
MPARPLVDLRGVVDLHVHAAPSYSHSRPLDDDVTARLAAEAGMRAIMIKDHTESTVTRAHLAQKVSPGVKVYGGIALNHPVGGVNPEAADFALTMGGRQVWMPTVDAARHAETFGPGGYRLRGSAIEPAEPDKKTRGLLRRQPIRILENGRLIDDAKDVVRICKAWDAMLGACHLYNEEIIELLKFAHAERFDKVLITHANWTVIRDTSAQSLREMADLGAWIEFCATAMLPPYSCLTLDQEVQWLNHIGTSRCILASDAGAQTAGTPASVLRAYLQLLNNAGVPLKDITAMACEQPARLLGLSDD